MYVTIALTLCIILFCVAILREENRRKSKSSYYLSNASKSYSDVNDNKDNEAVVALKSQIKDKDETIEKLRTELNELKAKTDTYLSLTKTSHELVLRNDERVQTVNKLWEEKNFELERQVIGMKEEVLRLKRQIEKADDELNSYQHKVNNLNRLLAQSEDHNEELESQVEQLIELEDVCQQKTQRIQHLQADIEHLEELRRKESEKFRNSVKERENKIQQLESICSELRMTSAVTSL